MKENEVHLSSSDRAVSPLVATVMVISSAIALCAVVIALALALKSTPVIGTVMLFTFTVALGAVIITLALALEAPK